MDEFEGIEPIRTINQSLIRGGETSFIFYSYNPPKNSGNWVNMESKKSRQDRYIHHSTYLQVPPEWLGKQFIIEAEHLKKVNENAYRHEYLGEEVGSGGEIFTNITIRDISDDEINDFDNIKRGIDFGYAIDPFVYGVMHFDSKRRKLYIYHELFEVGLSNAKAIEHIKKENKSNDYIIVDSSEPKSIGEYQKNGLKVIGAKKGADSIEYGIKFLQDLEEIIIDNKRCPNTAREFLSYELEQDNNGNWKSTFPDKNNHSIDMVRYALNNYIQRGFKHNEPKGSASTFESRQDKFIVTPKKENLIIDNSYLDY